MTSQEFKTIARLLKQVYQELELDAQKSGISPLSKEFLAMKDKVRLAVLEKHGFTLDEYRLAKAEVSGFSQSDMLSVAEEFKQIKKIVENIKIPTKDEIKEIAYEVSKEFIKPPQITNQIVKEVKIEQPKIIETVREITLKEEYNDEYLQEKIGILSKKIDELNIPKPLDVKKIEDDMTNKFSELFEHNINTLDMPNFRKLAMGLESRISTLENDESTAEVNKIIVNTGLSLSPITGLGNVTIGLDTAYIDASNRFLIDPDGDFSLGWGNRLLNDTNNQQSVDWQNRWLVKANESTAFDWQNMKFPTLTTNGILNVSNNDGTIGVDTNTYLTTTTHSFGLTVDGAGTAVTTGSKGFITIPYTCTINNWYLAADQSGSIVIDVKRSGTSIVGAGNKPTLSGAISGNAAASGWTSIAVTAGDILEFNVDSAATLTRINLVIKATQ